MVIIMTVYEAIKTRRTIRSFKNTPINTNDLLQIVDCARLAPYGANLQPLKFMIITDEDTRKNMFPHIKYAGYIPEWNPDFIESPQAFIAVLNDTTIKPTEKSECDSGAAVMSMCLASEELGISSCWLGAIDRTKLKEVLNLPYNLDITYLLGLGYKNQSGEVFDMTDSVKYYFDESGNVHVPKRTLKEVLVGK